MVDMDDELKERRTIIICGGGIAGLACALFISRCGYRAEVLEQASQLETHGAGIQLSPNAMHVLDQLGLRRHVTMAALAPYNIRMCNAYSAKKIIDIPLGSRIVRKYDQPYLVIHRGDLLKILYAACEQDPDIAVRFNVKIQDAKLHANGISVLGDKLGETGYYRGIAVIGADGVHSNIRKCCFDTRPAIYTGSCAIRGLVPASRDSIAEEIEPNTMIALGKNAHMVTYPVQSGKFTNVVVIIREQQQKNNEPLKITSEWINKNLIKWSPELSNILLTECKWTKWPLYQAPKLSFWARGPTALIGDAAHAMMPYAAQGAAMALEDAAQLGACLSTTNDIPKAFLAYQKQRWKRVKKIRKLTDANFQLYHMGNLFAPFRNLGMKILGGRLLLNRQNWVYRWKLSGQEITPTSSNEEANK